MKRFAKTTKFYWNAHKAEEALLAAKGYGCYQYIESDNLYRNKVIFHYDYPNEKLLKQLDIRARYPDLDVIEWDAKDCFQLDKENRQEIFYTHHKFLNHQNSAGEYLVFGVLGQDIEFKESD